eukprot:scaffold31195_cov68-Phaeocystis_antarctica.AAC.2
MRWDSANALWAICAPTAAPTDYGRKPGPPIHPIHSSLTDPNRRHRGVGDVAAPRQVVQHPPLLALNPAAKDHIHPSLTVCPELCPRYIGRGSWVMMNGQGRDEAPKQVCGRAPGADDPERMHGRRDRALLVCVCFGLVRRKPGVPIAMLLRLLHALQLLNIHEHAVEARHAEDLATPDPVALHGAATASRARSAIVPLRQHARLDHGLRSVRDVPTQQLHVFAIGHRLKDRRLGALQRPLRESDWRVRGVFVPKGVEEGRERAAKDEALVGEVMVAVPCLADNLPRRRPCLLAHVD